MVDHARLATVAERLLNANGRSLSFRGRVGLKDSGQPWLGKAAAEAVGTAIGVFTEYDAREIDGNLVTREDRKLLVATNGLEFTPSAEHEVVDDGAVWQVVSVKELRPGPTGILYELQVRA